MKLQSHWSFQDRFNTLRQIASESRQNDPRIAVLAISEANRMLEAAHLNPALLDSEGKATEPEALPHVFTPASLAERWGCSHRHVRNLIESGLLNCFRLGGKPVRIKTDEVLDYEARTHLGPEAANPAFQAELMKRSLAALETNIEPTSAVDAKKRKRPRPRLDTAAMRARWKMQQK